MATTAKDLRRYRFFDFLNGWKLDRYTDGGPSERNHPSTRRVHARNRALAAERARARKPRIQT